MEIKENLVVEETTEQEEHVEVEDLDAGLKKSDIEDVKAETRKKVIHDHVLNKEQQEIFKKMLKAADMPVRMTDAEFKLGKNELDIRGLSKSNQQQMIFRTQVLNNTYLKQLLTSLIDVTRLLMILCDKFGVEDIIGATDDIIEKVEKQRGIKKQLKQAKKDKIEIA